MAVHHRLKQLQRKARELAPPGPQWDIDDQIDDVLRVVGFHQRFKTRYEATDREIYLLVMWCIYEANDGPETDEPTGQAVLPRSKAVVRWRHDSSGEKVDLTLHSDSPVETLIEDLPEHVHPHVQRMPVAYQKEHEWWLYNDWLRRKNEEQAGQEPRTGLTPS